MYLTLVVRRVCKSCDAIDGCSQVNAQPADDGALTLCVSTTERRPEKRKIVGKHSQLLQMYDDDRPFELRVVVIIVIIIVVSVVVDIFK